MTSTPARCDTFWASHGCDRPAGHAGAHVCGLDDAQGMCSQAEIDPTGMAHVRYFDLGRPVLLEKTYLMPALRAGGREWTAA